jgi:outer membrane protein assembly factor BamB
MRAVIILMVLLNSVVRLEVPAEAFAVRNGVPASGFAFAGMTTLLQNEGSSRGNQALTGVVNENLPSKVKQLWSFKAGDEMKASPVVAGSTIVAGGMDGWIYALDLNGKLLWKFETGNGIEAPALILDNIVYVGNLTGILFALNLKDGKEKWRYTTEGQISGSANWWKTGNSIRILVGSYDYNLHCVDAATGKVIWKYESDNSINGATACVDGNAIFGGCDGFLHVVDIATGKASTRIDVATYVPGSAPSDGGLTYVGDYDGGFTCVSITEQKIKWKYKNEKTQLPFVASAAVSGDRVITGCRDKNVYCFGKADGKLIWKYNTGEKVDASPLICQDKVLIANMRGDLIALKLNDGTPVWTFETGTPIFGNPAVAGGKIYVGGQDGTIRCFGR